MERVYVYSLIDTPGVVAANNYVSIFVPSTSNRLATLVLSNTVNYAIGSSSTAQSMNIQRCSAASGGTLIAASNIDRFLSTDEDPAAQIRIGNPTTTLVQQPLVGYPPPFATGAGGGASSVQTSPPGASFNLLPGEGLVWYTNSGNTNQVWNIQFAWVETYLPTGN